VKHLYVTFVDPSFIGFQDVVWKMNKQTNSGENLTHTTAVGVGNKDLFYRPL